MTSAPKSDKITAALVGPGVDRVIHLRTQYLGPDELLVGMKVAVRGGDTAAEVADAIDALEARVRAAVPIARVIYIEPDIYHPAAVDAAASAPPAHAG